MANKKITDLQLRSDFDETCNVPVDDTIQTYRVTGQQILDFISGAPSPFLYNVTGTVAASALTLALKNRFGNNPDASNPIQVLFENTDGTYTIVNVTASTSTVISSGSTLNQISGAQATIYVYGMNNAGTLELAYSRVPWNTRFLQSTTAEGGAGGADSTNVLYSTTARTNKQITLLAILTNTQATTGTWATAPSNIAMTKANPPGSEIKVYGWLSNGSTNTAIARFSALAESQGAAITRATSSANGDSYTINERGIYAVTQSNGDAASTNIGISVNSNQLTTNINLITPANRMASALVSAADAFGCVAWTGILEVGDVVRPHNNTSAGTVTFTDASNFTICQVARL